MMDLILGNDPCGFSLGEVSSWFHPTRTHHVDIKCGCGVYPCSTWEKIKDVPQCDLYDRVFEVTGAEFIIDSSKQLTWVIDQTRMLLKQGRHEVRHLFLYKDPVSLAYSHWKRGRSDLSGIVSIYDYYVRALQAGFPMMTAAYDWLIDDKIDNLALVCEKLGIESHADKIRFWEKTHHQLFGSFGPRKMLFSEKPEIYREQFDSEFVEQIPEIEAKYQANPKMAAILHLLRSHDVRAMTCDLKSKPPRRPVYYFLDKLRLARTRGRLVNYPDREASTIREWNV